MPYFLLGAGILVLLLYLGFGWRVFDPLIASAYGLKIQRRENSNNTEDPKVHVGRETQFSTTRKVKLTLTAQQDERSNGTKNPIEPGDPTSRKILGDGTTNPL